MSASWRGRSPMLARRRDLGHWGECWSPHWIPMVQLPHHRAGCGAPGPVCATPRSPRWAGPRDRPAGPSRLRSGRRSWYGAISPRFGPAASADLRAGCGLAGLPAAVAAVRETGRLPGRARLGNCWTWRTRRAPIPTAPPRCGSCRRSTTRDPGLSRPEPDHRRRPPGPVGRRRSCRPGRRPGRRDLDCRGRHGDRHTAPASPGPTAPPSPRRGEALAPSSPTGTVTGSAPPRPPAECRTGRRSGHDGGRCSPWRHGQRGAFRAPCRMRGSPISATFLVSSTLTQPAASVRGHALAPGQG